MISILGDVFLDKKITIEEGLLHENILLNCEHVITRRSGSVTNKIILRTGTSHYRTSFNNRSITASLANNHTLDLGAAGLDDTIETCVEDGIKVFGYDDRTSITLNIGKASVNVFTWVLPETNPIYGNESPYLPRFELEHACEAIEAAKTSGNECIVFLHWGEEEITRPSVVQRNIAHRLIDSGALLIVGTHSHCPGPVETYRGRKIFYSIGNFYFPDINVDYIDQENRQRKIRKVQRARNLISIIVHINCKLDVKYEYVFNQEGYIKRYKFKPGILQLTQNTKIELLRAKLLWVYDNPWLVVRKIKNLYARLRKVIY